MTFNPLKEKGMPLDIEKIKSTDDLVKQIVEWKQNGK